MRFHMADAEVPASDAEGGGDCAALAGEFDAGLARGGAENFDVRPGDAAGPAGAEGFEDGFLRGEAAGEMLGVAFGIGGAIGLLAGSEAAIEEPLAVVAGEVGDAACFDEINAVSDDGHRESIRFGGRVVFLGDVGWRRRIAGWKSVAMSLQPRLSHGIPFDFAGCVRGIIDRARPD